MPYKNIYFAKHQKHIKEGSGSGSGRIRSFWGHPDPDPDFKNRIRGSGSEKNGPDPQHFNPVKESKFFTELQF